MSVKKLKAETVLYTVLYNTVVTPPPAPSSSICNNYIHSELSGSLALVGDGRLARSEGWSAPQQPARPRSG
jgi:hypothetical protein